MNVIEYGGLILCLTSFPLVEPQCNDFHSSRDHRDLVHTSSEFVSCLNTKATATVLH